MSKQRLLFITTGGTIASVRTQQGLKPVLGAHAGNGAAGGDKKQTLFGHKAKAPCGSNFNVRPV